MIRFRICVIACLLLFLVPFSSAAHFVVGQVSDALDGTLADGHTIILWNPLNGTSDNVSDTIGPTGNSGSLNTYMVDCELLQTECEIGQILRLRVINEGDGYVTNETSVTITGGAFDIASTMRLNSRPNITLVSPVNYVNLTNLDLNLSCNAIDLDDNLANVTLYSNWTGTWSSNETKSITGGEGMANFTKNLLEGRYLWSCLATDSLSISSFALSNFTFTIDASAPNISSVLLNASYFCSVPTYVRVNCTAQDAILGVESVLIESTSPSGVRLNATGQLIPATHTYYADFYTNETGFWNFMCTANDTAGFTSNRSSLAFALGSVAAPDLSVSAEDLLFDSIDAVENESVTLRAVIRNIGCGTATSAYIALFEGDPDAGGRQVGTNVTTTIVTTLNSTINFTWPAKIGSTNLYVYADFNHSITELDEDNNKAYQNFNLTGWQLVYGNATINKLLANNQLRNLSTWANESFFSGTVFITDSESAIDWFELRAIGLNASGDATSDDFNDIDVLLNMTTLADSVTATFTSDGNTPISTRSIQLHNQIVPTVPYVNFTGDSSFGTGILWDSSDDTNGEYSQSDREDLVFVTEINRSAPGLYGIYDYEISIPARLREYRSPDIQTVYVYFDLN